MLATLEANQVVALAVAVLACGFDLRTRRIPNVLTFGAAGVAFAHAAWTQGFAGLATSIAGWLTGCGMFLPFFLLKGMGAGDVKLMAAIGAWLAPRDTLWTALYTMIAGGLMGVVVALATGYFGKAVTNLRLLLMQWRVTGVRPLPELTLSEGKGPRLPYAIPIAVGTLTSVLLR